MLEQVADRINKVTGNPTELITRSGDAAIGHYYIDGSYGGYALYQVTNKGGGAREIFNSGHIPARELYLRMHAFLEGIDATRYR